MARGGAAGRQLPRLPSLSATVAISFICCCGLLQGGKITTLQESGQRSRPWVCLWDGALHLIPVSQHICLLIFLTHVLLCCCNGDVGARSNSDPLRRRSEERHDVAGEAP
jgi:hypothetical protein